MQSDYFLNLGLFVIITFIAVYVFMKVFYKPFSINVRELPAGGVGLMLEYQCGFKRAKAKLIVSDTIVCSRIIRNFDHFSFVIPMNGKYKDILNWLHVIDVSEHYSPEGKDTLELLRAVLLYQYTGDLEAFKPFTVRCNHLRILQTIRKNRNLLKQFMAKLEKPDYSKLPMLRPM